MSTGRHAGFASVLTVGEDFVNGMLAAATTLVPSPSFSLPDVVNVGSDTIGISGSVSLLTPSLSFAKNADNLVGVACGASGVLRLTSNGGELIEVDVTLTFSFSVGLFVKVSPTTLALGPDFSQATVSSVDVAVKFGPPLAQVYQDAIKSATTLEGISTALRRVPQSSVTFTVPGATGTIDLTLLYTNALNSVAATFGGFIIGPHKKLLINRVVAVPLNGVLNIACDVSPYTSGDPSQLVNLITTASPGPLAFVYDRFGDATLQGGTIAGHAGFGTNLAATVNADFLCAVVNGPLSSLVAGTAIDGVTVNSLSLSIGSVPSVSPQSNLPSNWYGSLSL
jgi:hypothetical protein